MQATAKIFSARSLGALASMTALGGVAVSQSEQVAAAEAQGTPQDTVIADGYTSGGFVIIHLAKGADLKAVARALAGIDGITKAVSTNAIDNVGVDSDDGPAVIASVAFSGKVWEGLKGSKPNALTEYKTRTGKHGNTFPATGGDIMIHIKGVNKSVCFEVVGEALAALPTGAVHTVQDFYGFKYQDGRDLSGFIDGTANPGGDEERTKVAVIPSGPNAGGSCVMTQVWQHDFDAIRSLKQSSKEAVIGREQPNSAPISPPPEGSHFEVLTRDNEGESKIQVVRHSMPYGSHGGKAGLFFICYGASSRQMDFALDRMIGKDGVQDKTFSITKPVTGQYFYVPSKEQLKTLA